MKFYASRYGILQKHVNRFGSPVLHSQTTNHLTHVGEKLLQGNRINLFTLLSSLAIAISYADRSNMSTAVIPMAAEFNWDSVFSGVVLSAFWGGYAVTQVIGGKLADKYGGEKILVFALLAWSLCTGLTPVAAAAGSLPLILVRVLLGAGEGLAFPSIHTMINKYVDEPNQSASTSFITAACYAGALISNLVSPMLIEAGGFRACFELFALFPPLIWLPLWLRFISLTSGQKLTEFKLSYDDRNVLEDVANNEITSIISSNSGFHGTNTTVVDTSDQFDCTESLREADSLQQEPVSANLISSSIVSSIETFSVATSTLPNVIITSNQVLSLSQLIRFPAVWAIIFAQYGQSWGMIGLLSWLPTYYSDKFHVPLSELSSFTVLPYFLQMMTSIIAGVAADSLINSGIRRLYVRQAFQIIGMLLPAACLAYCAWIPDLTSALAYILINIGTAASALTTAAVSCNHFDISPRNAGTIFGIGNTASCLGGLIAVPLSGLIYERTQSWEAVFYVFVAHYLLGAGLWGVLASDSPLVEDSNPSNEMTALVENSNARIGRDGSSLG